MAATAVVPDVDDFRRIVCSKVQLRSDAIAIFKAAGLSEADQVWPQSLQAPSLDGVDRH
jgi:hypothetical protein